MDVVVGPGGGSIRRNGGFEEIEPQCLVDLNRLTVDGMEAQIPQIDVLGALGGSAPSLSPPPARKLVQANFGDLEYWGHCWPLSSDWALTLAPEGRLLRRPPRLPLAGIGPAWMTPSEGPT